MADGDLSEPVRRLLHRFGYFSAAFALLVVQRIVLAATVGERVDPGVYYLIRLIAFLPILVAIVEKNRSES